MGAIKLPSGVEIQLRSKAAKYLEANNEDGENTSTEGDDSNGE